MATIAGVRSDPDNKSVSITWTNLVQSTSDVGSGIYIGDLEDVTAQAIGTSGTTCVIQGSNDGVNFNTLGAGITLTIGASGSSPVLAITPKPLFIRPATPSAAADTDIVISGGRRRY